MLNIIFIPKWFYGKDILIELIDRKESENLSFEESKQSIKEHILSEKQNKLLKEYLNKLEEKADIKIYKENINKVNQDE